jgi:hypothetical protein
MSRNTVAIIHRFIVLEKLSGFAVWQRFLFFKLGNRDRRSERFVHGTLVCDLLKPRALFVG